MFCAIPAKNTGNILPYLWRVESEFLPKFKKACLFLAVRRNNAIRGVWLCGKAQNTDESPAFG
jgi:hypothetical protein